MVLGLLALVDCRHVAVKRNILHSHEISIAATVALGRPSVRSFIDPAFAGIATAADDANAECKLDRSVDRPGNPEKERRPHFTTGYPNLR